MQRVWHQFLRKYQLLPRWQRIGCLLGALLINSIHSFDIPVVMTTTVIFAILVVAFNLIADILYGVLDPRIQYR